MVAVYVDDLLVASNDETSMMKLKNGLKSAFQIKDLGKAKYCLGIEIKQEDSEISLCQKRYIDELLKKFNMSNCNPQSTPASPTSKLQPRNDPKKCTKNPEYRELVGSLMYLSVTIRPDISHSMSCYDVGSCAAGFIRVLGVTCSNMAVSPIKARATNAPCFCFGSFSSVLSPLSGSS